jgi:flagellar basal body-associated protein FliL
MMMMKMKIMMMVVIIIMITITIIIIVIIIYVIFVFIFLSYLIGRRKRSTSRTGKLPAMPAHVARAFAVFGEEERRAKEGWVNI